jgi:hypothetical protein
MAVMPAAHQRAEMVPPGDDALLLEQILQHPAAGERQLETQLVDPAHQPQRVRRHRPRRVVDRCPREPQQPRLARDRQLLVRVVDHRFPFRPGPRLSALAKKSISSDCWPILACTAFTSTAGSRASPSLPNAALAPATSCRRHSVI